MKKLFIVLLLLFLASTAYADPLVQPGDLTYLGAFKLPSGTYGTTSFGYSGGDMAYNATNNSLFVSGHVYQSGHIAEVSIPTPVNSSNLSSLNTSTVLQNFADLTEGNLAEIGAGGAACTGTSISFGGMMVYGNRIIGTSYMPYDTSDCSQRSHFYSGKTISTTGDFHGMYQLSGTPGASFVDKTMTPVPAAWQSSLGGPALTGATGMSIVSRASWGPSAFAFDPDQLGVTVPLPVTPLLYYNSSHMMFGTANWNNTNPYWNGTTRIEGMDFIENTRTVLFFGVHGTGTYCYGDVPPCSDPISSAKGDHSSQWDFQFWAYDAEDLVYVKNRTKQPWEPLSYAVWNITLSFGGVRSSYNTGGSAYDPATQRLYLMQPNANSDYPVIHVFQISASGSADTTPNAFTFTDNTGAARSTVIYSTPITVLGIDNTTSITSSGTGCSYQVNGTGSWLTMGGDNVALNDTIAMKTTSSASYGDPVNCTLTLNGNVSDTWTVTTLGGGDTVPPASPTGLSAN